MAPRRRLRCVRPRSKAAGDVRCTKSIMRVTMATAQPPTDAAPQHQFMIWKGPSLSIGRASFKRPSGLIEHERNSGSRSRFEPGRFERGEHHIITLREFAFARQYFPQIKGESAAICRDHLTWTTMDHVSFGLTAQLLVCYETPRLGRRAAIPSEIKSLERTNRSMPP